MGCGGDREKQASLSAEQKWDYINLSDFKSTSCFTPLSYGILYIALIISVACYAVDLFTAVNLLVFDRWSGQVKPYIPFQISRWIFAGCIILSWLFLIYRVLRAVRAMRTGGVARSYLDPLAVRIQCIRMGQNGRGWRRFLVFAELTKSKKGTDYVALFAHFSFEAWMRILFAEFPRNAINAITLYSVMQLNIIPTGKHAASQGHTPVVQFFVNVKLLADENREQAVILFGMLFTLIIWVFAALSLAISCILYIFFLWHHIPTADGGLTGYCKRKVDSRLHKIVKVKVNKALAKNEGVRASIIPGSLSGGDRPMIKKQPTIPVLQGEDGDKLMDMPLSRQTTGTTLPLYQSRSSSRNEERQPTLPEIFPQRPRPSMPSRSVTQSSAMSNGSYSSNAPLIGGASPIGYGSPESSQPSSPPDRTGSDRSMFTHRPGMDRSATGRSQETQRSMTPGGGYSSSSQGRMTPGPPSRQGTGMSNYSTGGFTPGPFPRSNTGMSNYSNGRNTPGPPPRSNTDLSNYAPNGRSSPGPPKRQNTGMSDYFDARGTPNPPSRTGTGMSNYTPSGRGTQGPNQPPRLNTVVGNYPPSGRSTSASQYTSPAESYGRRTPASNNPSPADSYARARTPASSSGITSTRQMAAHQQSYEMRPQPPLRSPSNDSGFVAYNPNTSARSTPVPTQPPTRNFSSPMRTQPQQADYFAQREVPQRSGTAPIVPPSAGMESTYHDSIYDAYASPGSGGLPPRAATAGPGRARW